MSEQDLGANGSSEQLPDGGAENKKDTVSYTTYSKVMSTLKSREAKLAELSEKVANFERQEEERQGKLLEEQGKFKEALDAKAKRALELEAELKKTKQVFAKKVFTEKAKAEALQAGVIPDGVDDFIKAVDWDGVEIGEDFSVNHDQLKEKIAKAQETKGFFFAAKKPTGPKDLIPKDGSGNNDFSLNQMKHDDLKKLLAQKLAKK